MPSKKKARGKARRAAKSRKAKEDGGAVNGITSEMQRLQISNNKTSKDKDEDALLEAAINLATAEREKLEAAGTNDEKDISKECYHGFVPWPRGHVCEAFLESFIVEFNACCRSSPSIYELFGYIYEATKTKYTEVWNDSDMVQWSASRLVMHVANLILEGNYSIAARFSMCSSFFEQWAAVLYQNESQASCVWDKFVDYLCDWGKMSELYLGDEHTIVSFFRKRIPCKCLDDKYKKVKFIKKIGFCNSPTCSLPERKTLRSKMLYCTQCRKANYCSRECQVANWPTHKEYCALIAENNKRAAKNSRQKKSMNSVQGENRILQNMR